MSHEVPFTVLFAPVGEATIGEFTKGHGDAEVTGKETELIALADLIEGDTARLPTDLNTTGEEGKHDGVNGRGAGFGVDEHGGKKKNDLIGWGAGQAVRP